MDLLRYHFSRFNEEGIESKKLLSLILISQKNIFDMLDLPSISTFKRGNIVRLDRYSRDELLSILEQRVELAFHSDSVELGVSELISDIASEWGDARYSIELLWRAGKFADEEGMFKITPEYVRQAKSETHPVVRREVLRDLPKIQKVLLVALARLLKRTGQAYVTTGELEKAFSVSCEEYGFQPRKHTQLWDYIRQIERHDN